MTSAARWERPRILVVDDNAAGRRALVRELDGIAAEIHEAASGNEALAATLEHHFAAVLLDVSMPGMDGYEVASLMHAEEQTRDVPILFLTAAFRDRDHRLRAYETGCVDYMEKPVDPVILRAKVGVFLELERRRIRLSALLAEREDGNQRLRAEIGERREAELMALNQAHFDPLTGLPNRMLFLDRLDRAIRLARRARARMGLMFLDLDRFKQINDTLGHGIGDRLLAEVARRLEQGVRASDTVARLGGDEFTVICSGIHAAEDLEVVARKVLRALAAPFEIDGHELYATASIGITLCPEDGADTDSLLRNADTAMYRAKDAGRNGFVFFRSEMNERVRRRMEMETALRQGLEAGDLRVFYQPIIDLVTGDLWGAEALLRWQHPDLGLVAPAEFIPLAEETGLILALGRWVLDAACGRFRDWAEAGLLTRGVINVSAAQCRHHDLAGLVENALTRHGLAPERLILDITEDMVLDNSETALAALGRLHDLGVGLCLDDFGTGYSALNHLRVLPVCGVKIDHSFVADLPEDGTAAALVSAIVAMAHGLDHRVIAEGVETAAQLADLRARGCDLAQGYLFSPPLAADAFEARLRAGDGWWPAGD